MSDNEISDDLIMMLLSSPIAYSRIYPSLTGSATGSILLGQAFYWFGKTEDRNGWFFKTNEEWCDETGLSEEELYGAKKKIEEFLEIERRGMPPKMFYRVKLQTIKEAIRERRFKRPLSKWILQKMDASLPPPTPPDRKGEFPETTST